VSACVLEGDLGHFFPTEILQLLQLSQANGRLQLERPGETADLFFERGRPVFARTNGPSVRAGQVLVHRGQLTPEALERALAAQQTQSGVRLGELLVSQGLVQPHDLADAVRDVLRRIVYRVLLWRDGRFRFYQGERAEGEDIRIDVELDRMILEGLRQADQERSTR
jgi:hypothetical protein